MVYPAGSVASAQTLTRMDEGFVASRRHQRRRRTGSGKTIFLGALAIAAVAGVGVGAFAAGAVGPTSSPTPSQALASPSATPTPTATPSPTPEPTPTPIPTPAPTPTPEPTPKPVRAPLTGRLVSPNVAKRHPIAVMIDDHQDARPQSGFNDAAIVWHAPAEGGIPRYMLIFQDRVPPSVGPVRSARQYYIAWAAEWKAVYAHVGGSPQAMQTLREQGRGQLVYNADEFRWGGTYFHRTRDRFAPHNVYTSGKELWRLAARVGAKNTAIKPAWRFGLDKHVLLRPTGTRITVVYSQNTVTYRYDRRSNTYLRSVSGEKRQMDRGVDKPVAPKNVIVMSMSFGRLNDGSRKNRLEAQFIGRGTAWISTNGTTVKGTWRKRSMTDPTRFYNAEGRPVRLTVGQTFIQVMPRGSKITIKDGKAPKYIPTYQLRRYEAT
jgi:Protein of unknown function (DUF3048) N-terminal domain/Protein of unknown function (DUF3048) C-terminal domain